VKLIDRVKDISCNTTVSDSRSSHASLSALFRVWEVRIEKKMKAGLSFGEGEDT